MSLVLTPIPSTIYPLPLSLQAWRCGGSRVPVCATTTPTYSSTARPTLCPHPRCMTLRGTPETRPLWRPINQTSRSTLLTPLLYLYICTYVSLALYCLVLSYVVHEDTPSWGPCCATTACWSLRNWPRAWGRARSPPSHGCCWRSCVPASTTLWTSDLQACCRPKVKECV